MSAILARALLGLLLVGTAGERLSSGDRRGAVWSEERAELIEVEETRGAIEYESECIYRICRVTAYCDRGLTAAGTSAGVGQCAAPADIPFGSRVYIPALDRSFIVTDRTAKRFRHSTVDLFMPGREECVRFGRRYLECEITTPREALRYGSSRLREAAESLSRTSLVRSR